jgi:SSS family solute:Na+ symporter
MSLLIVASGILVIVGVVEAGGIGAIARETPESYWKLFLPSDNPDFPWHAILLGYPILGVWFWCTDQSMVQSVLGAKSLRTGQYGTNVCAWLKVIDMPLFILPGILCFILFPDLANPDEAYMTMVKELLPHGMIGLIMTVLMAALISTIASALNSLSTVFTLDIYVRRFRPEANTADKVRIGRVVTALGGLLAILLALLISMIEGLDLFSLFQAVLGFLAPPLTTVFLVGALWKKATPRAANLILILGTAFSLGIGVLYFAGWPSKEVWPHFMMLTFYICSFLTVAMIVISLLTQRGSSTTGYVSLREAVASDTSSACGVYLTWGLLILLMCVLYIVFN